MDGSSQLLTKPSLLTRLGLLSFVSHRLSIPPQRNYRLLKCHLLTGTYRRVFIAEFIDQIVIKLCDLGVANNDARENAVLQSIPRSITLEMCVFGPVDF